MASEHLVIEISTTPTSLSSSAPGPAGEDRDHVTRSNL